MGGVAVLHPQDVLNENIFSTPVKSRRTPKPSPNFSNSSPKFTRSEGRRRSPPSGVRRNKSTAAMVVDPPQTAVAKSLVMGQVKILKRGEPLIDESSTVLKEMNDRKVSNDTATTTPTKDVAVAVVDRKVASANRRVLPPKKKSEKEKRSFSIPNPKSDDVKNDDFALSSTNRLGPDPEMVPLKKNNITDFFFAGSAFVDSPPPSSLPLPGFFTKKEDPSSDLRRMLGLNLS